MRNKEQDCPNPKKTNKINSMISEIGLINGWRDLNPTIRNYTLFSSPYSTYSRTYYFLLFIIISDHCLLYLSLKMTSRRKVTYWRFNSSLLNKQKIERFVRYKGLSRAGMPGWNWSWGQISFKRDLRVPDYTFGLKRPEKAKHCLNTWIGRLF